MRELTLQEIDQVGGGLANFVYGGAIGGGAYVVYQSVTGQPMTAAGFTGSVVAGAATSGFSALAGGGTAAYTYFSGVGAVMGGGSYNAMSYYGSGR